MGAERISKYQISKSVAGNIVIMKAKTPELALMRYIRECVLVNLDTGNWNFDFEITIV